MSKQTIDLRNVLILGLAAALIGCAVGLPQRQYVASTPLPPPPRRLVVYPSRGQNAEQLDRDRYECHLWAVQQSGFDPSRPGTPPSERVVVQPAVPPGSNTAVGAIAGAIFGAAIAGPRNAGAGLVFGGVTGAAIGASSDAANEQAARVEQEQINQSNAIAQQQNVGGMQNYRRALTACLVGRGYTVN